MSPSNQRQASIETKEYLRGKLVDWDRVDGFYLFKRGHELKKFIQQPVQSKSPTKVGGLPFLSVGSDLNSIEKTIQQEDVTIDDATKYNLKQVRTQPPFLDDLQIGHWKVFFQCSIE